MTDARTAKEDDANRPGATTALDGTHCPEPENINLRKVVALTMQLQSQLFKLQGEVSEQKDKVASTKALEDQVFKLQAQVSEQQEQLALVTKEASALALLVSSTIKEGVVSAARDRSLIDIVASPLSSPRKRLGQIFRSISRSRSPSRSISPEKSIRSSHAAPLAANAGGHWLPLTENNVIRSRSASPKKNVHPHFEDIDDMGKAAVDRNHSPSRRIEARIAPRLLSNMTCFVDGQIQNLELRIVSMETSFENWRQSTIPNGAVDGMCASDLQMLSGLNVVKSRADDLQMLLGPSVESVNELPSCSTANTKAGAGSDRQKSSTKRDKKASSWSRLFRRAT